MLIGFNEVLKPYWAMFENPKQANFRGHNESVPPAAYCRV